MRKAGWIVLFNVSMLLSTAVLADDSKSPGTGGEPLPVLTLSEEASLAELKYASRWQLLPPAEAMAYSDDQLLQIADFNFRDTGALARVSKLHSLSLLTLVEIRQKRLFLGVNSEGVIGLHFGNFSHHSDERFLELARMPYLKESPSVSDIE